jgi:cytochrome c oxidase subunit 2
LQKAGQATFLEGPCASCHSIRGTTAGGQLGPDLTHLASRTTLAAGTAEQRRGTLAAWVVDPQSMKPGTNMPTIKLEPDELNSLLDYLMGLT